MFKYIHPSRHVRVWTLPLLLVLTFLSITPSTYVHAQSKGPGPRAAHCVVEHGNVLYFLGGTPPTSTNYAAFTSLKLPLNSVSSSDPESFPWSDLPNPPVPVQITNVTMTYSSSMPTVTPSWSDCFATDDGRIVVVGGSFQVLVYNIATSTWGDTNTPANSIKYGPSVQSSMFLDPVYIQSRILADGYTALIVCTLRWNSQPQPYYLNTNTWTVTLAIGTSDTTPPSSSSSSNGWGVIPGGGPMLPPAGFRHFSLAILGQDKGKASEHYGNGQAFIIGGYSTLVTGQVSDWDTLTSFPVQQAPSKSVIMFGNAGKLAKVTRGSVAYPVSRTLLDIFPGNGGGSNTAQDIGVYDANLNTVSMLSGVTGGPRNTIFRGAAVIGQGQQIFVHGGLRTLEFGSSSPLLDYLDQSVGVWNGDTQQWGDTVNIVVPKKSKTLMIGLIAGGVVLVVLIALGVWYFRKRQRIRRLEEEERQTKGMVLKNEDKLQKEHRASRQNNNENGTPPAAHGPAILHHNQIGMTGSEVGIYNPLHQPAHGYVESFTVGRNSTAELYHQNAHQSHVEYPYAEAELIDEVAAVEISKSRAVNNPQEFPTKNSNGAGMYGDISRAPSHYQAVVSVAGQPVYGMPSYGVSKQEHNEQESPQLTEDLQNLGKLRASQDASRTSLDPLPTRSSYTIPSSADIRASLYSQAVSTGSRPSAAAARDSYTSAHPYSNASSTSFTPQIASQMTPYMSSPTFSATYSVPDSMQGSDTAHPSLMRSNPSAGDLMDQSAHMYSYPSQTKTSVDPNAVPYQMTEAFSNSQPAIPYQSRP